MSGSWQEAVQVIEDSHDDLLEILGAKLVSWLTESGSVTFNLTSGNFTVDSLPQIQAGTTTVVAGENLAVNTAVKLVDDSGTTKAYALDEESYTSSLMSSGGEGEAMYYSTTYDRTLVVYEDTGNDINAVIGTVASDKTMSFGSENAVLTGGTSVSDVKVVPISATEFVISWIDNENVFLRAGKFTSETAISFGAQLDCSLTDVKKYVITSDETDTLNLVTVEDDGASSHKLESRIYDYTTGTMSLAIVGTVQTVYDAGTYGNGYFILTNRAFDVGYNTDDNIFHIFYTHFDADYSAIFAHRSVTPATGVLGTEDEITTMTSTTPTVAETAGSYPIGIFYDSGNSQILMYGAYLDITFGTFKIYALRFGVTSGRVTLIKATFIHDYTPSTSLGKAPYVFIPHYDSERGETYVVYHNGYTKAYLLKYNAQYEDDRLIDIQNYASHIPSYGIVETSNNLIIADDSNGIYVYTYDERGDFIGVVTETISSGQNITLCPIGYKASSFSSLTTGATYYLQSDLSITTTKSSHRVGKALNSTTLQLI